MKLRTKKTDSHGMHWLEAILSKPWEKDPKRSYYEFFNAGFLGGRENQRRDDARICARLYDKATTTEEQEAIKKCFDAIMQQTIRKPQ